MPRLSIKSILDARYPADMSDGVVEVHDGNPTTLDVGGMATISIAYSGDITETIEVSINAGADSRAVSRVNRLLDGLKAPKVETYHRTGTVMVRTPGAPTPIPCTFKGKHDGAMAWSWDVVAATATPTPTPPKPVIDSQQLNAPVAAITVPKAPAGDLFPVPPRSTTHRIQTPAENRDMLATAWALHQDGTPTTVMLEGPTGTGKTSIVDDFAADEQVGVFVYDGAAASTWADWTGTTVLDKDGGTRFAWSSFITAIREDGPYGNTKRIVLIDELNRAESAAANNALMPMLSQGRIFVPEADETVIVSKSVFFVFTMNRGYAGTQALDEALANRMWTTIRMETLGEQEEAALVLDRVPGVTEPQAAALVKVARQVRDMADRGTLDEGISTRAILQAAAFVAKGRTLRQAATFCWANALDAKGGAESDRGQVVQVIESLLPR